MEYFEQLLVSYCKLKKRKLRLVENQDPAAIAQAELQQAQSQNPPPSTSQPYVTQGARFQVAIFFTAKGLKFAPVASDGRPNVGKSKFIQTDYNTFVGYFAPDEEGMQPQGQDQGQAAKMEPGDLIKGGEQFGEFGEDINPVVDNIQEMAAMVDEVYSNLPKDLMDGKQWGSPAAFSNYVFGGRRQSLESLLLNNKLKIVFDSKSGEYLSTVAPPNLEGVTQVSDNLRELFKYLTEKELSTDQKVFVKNTIAVNSDGSVSIFADIKKSGLVFKDQNGFLKMIAKAFGKKFRVVVKKIDVKRNVGSGLDNVIRGVALEEILPILAMQKAAIHKQVNGLPGADVLLAGVKEAYKGIKGKLAKMASSYQSWVKQFDESAIEHEEKDIIDAFSAIFSGGGSDLISSMVKASKDSVFVRNPDFIITKGKETGEGRRQDTLEVFSDEMKCIQALKKMGYSTDEIASKGLVKAGTTEEVFGDRKDLLKIALKSGTFGKGQTVFYSPVSLKNYIDLHDATFGTTTEGSNRAFLNGKSKDAEKTFLRMAQQIVDIPPSKLKGVSDYNNSLGDIGKKIGKLNAKARTVSKTGKTYESSPFKSFVDDTLGVLKKTSTYGELYENDSARKDLALILQRYKDSEEPDEKTEERIKKFTSTFVSNQKIATDIQGGSEEAKNYLAMKLVHTGGSVDDGLVCDYRGLESGENYNFLQNDVIRDVVSSWMKGVDDWIFTARGNHFYWTNRGNPKAKIVMSDKVEKSGDGFDTKSSVMINRELMKMYNKKKKTTPKLEGLLKTYFSSQQNLFEELIVVNS